MESQTDFTPIANLDPALSQTESWTNIQGDVEKIIQETVVETIIGSITVDEALSQIAAMNENFNMKTVLADINANF